MSQSDVYTIPLRAVAVALVKALDLHKGLWMLGAEMEFAALNTCAGMPADLATLTPSILARLTSLRLVAGDGGDCAEGRGGGGQSGRPLAGFAGAEGRRRMSNPLVILLALSLTWLCVFALAWCYGQLAVKVEHIEETIRVLVANLSGQQQEGDATHGPR